MRHRRARRRGGSTLSLLLLTLMGIVLVASGCFGGEGGKQRKAAYISWYVRYSDGPAASFRTAVLFGVA